MIDVSSVQSSSSIYTWRKEKQVEISQHPAWHGLLTEQEAEVLLKNQTPYTYILRGTEDPMKFYLSFIQPDLTPDHRLFVMQDASGWFYQNFDPHRAAFLKDLIPQIMHCPAQNCLPLCKQITN